MPDPDFFVKRGDSAPTITDTCRDADGDPVSISGADVLLVLCRIDVPRTYATGHVAENLEVGAETLGQVQYVWQDDDLDEAGLYLGEWEVTYADSRVLTFPNGGYFRVLVSPDLQPAAP